MQDTIVCPECKRRLVLPPGVRDIVAQCPSCGTRFPSHPPEELEPAWPRESLPLEPPARDPRPEPAPHRYEDSPPVAQEKPTNWAPLSWVGFFACVLIVCIAREVFFPRGGTNRPVASPPNLVLRDVERGREIELKDLGRENLDAGRKNREFQPLFDDLHREFKIADGRRLVVYFDVNRMAEEVLGVKPVAKPALSRSLEVSLPALLEKQASEMAWSSLEVRSVTRLGDDEAVVETQLANSVGKTHQVRWWLIRRLGDWRVYDMKDLVTGKKLSLSAGFPDAGP